MGRSRLSIGEFGEISSSRVAGGWRSRSRYRNSAGVIRQLGASAVTKKKAEAALRRKMSAVDLTHRGTALMDDNPSVADLGHHWLVSRRVSDGREQGTISPSTRDQYRHVLEKTINPSLGSLLLSEVTVPRAEAFLESLIDGPAGSNRALQAKTVLKQSMDMAVRYGYLGANPVTSIRPFPIDSASPPRAWSANDIERVRRAVGEWASRANGRRGPENPWLPALLETMLGTAGRISEALALSWDRVHLDVERPWVRIDRCVREPKRGPHTVGPTKSGDVRDLEIPSFLVVVLLQLRPAHPGQSPVFATSKGTWLRPSAAHRAFRSALDASGIDRSIERHLRPHGARKTAATAIAREAGLEDAAAQLGHVGTHTAQRHYIEPEERAIITNGAILQTLASHPA